MTRMGEVEGVSGHPGGSTYSRGHRSTPSQESNTLSQVFTFPHSTSFLRFFLRCIFSWQVSCTTDISLVDELEDVEEGLREVRGEEEEGRSGSSTSSGEQQGRRSPGEEGSRTVSPLSKLKVRR